MPLPPSADDSGAWTDDSGALSSAGQPLHTRTVAVSVFQDEPGVLRAEGEILDLRKAGWVPTGGTLQTAGFIHHMKLHLWVPLADGAITRVEVSQPHVPFEARPETGGESCRDVVPRLQALVGHSIEESFPRHLAGCFGGALGCSHLLTLAQAMGAVVPPALDRERAAGQRRKAGETVASRAIFLDGFGTPEGGMGVQIQLSDFATRPVVEAATPFERLLRHAEVQTRADVDLETMTIRAIEGVERIREGAAMRDDAWTDRSALLVPLVGGPALRGLAGTLFRHYGGHPDQRLLLDAMLQFAPGLIQCFAARTGQMLARVADARGHPPGGSDGGAPMPRELGVGGTPDSCYVWRAGGVMARYRGPTDGG